MLRKNHMTERQLQLLRHHADLAAFAVTADTPVFVIADLEDKDGLEIACQFEPQAASKRDATLAAGQIPAYTFCLPVDAANALIESGWPELKRLKPPPSGLVPVLLFSGGTLLSALVPSMR